MDEMKKNNEELVANKSKKIVANKKEKGATMLEYGVMIALILAVCVAIVKNIGTTLQGKFTTVNTNIQ